VSEIMGTRGPKVSVCVPTYNGSAYLPQCLESILNQDFEDFELLIVDDCSSDSTVSLAEEIRRRDARVRVTVNKHNLGLVGNWNRCVQIARCEWIKFVFQDDIIAPSCISAMVKAIRPGVDLVVVQRSLDFAAGTSEAVRNMYRDCVSAADITKYFPGATFISPSDFASLVLRVPHRNFIGEPTSTLVRASAFSKFGYFNPKLVSLCDWEYFARIAVNTGLCYVNETLASFRVHHTSRSAEIRDLGDFSALTIDPLLIQYNLAHGKHYAPLRAVAAKQDPPVDLKRRLGEALRRAHWEALGERDVKKAKAELRRALKAHPKMLLSSLGQFAGSRFRK
jgi:glycosyltransferase involved in cell wall biosynthesis